MAETTSESFIATKPGLQHETSILTTSSEPISLGNEAKKKFTAEIAIPSRPQEWKHRELKLVKKDVTTWAEKNENSSDRFLEIWQRLHDLGLPVVPSVRKINDNEVIMTDLTRDGSEFYGKARGWHPDRSPWKLKNEFHQIDPEAIKQEASRLAQIATENGIVLAQDDPFEVLVHPDGSWNLILLDISATLLPGSYSKLETDVIEENNEAVKSLMSYVSVLRNDVETKEDPAKTYYYGYRRQI